MWQQSMPIEKQRLNEKVDSSFPVCQIDDWWGMIGAQCLRIKIFSTVELCWFALKVLWRCSWLSSFVTISICLLVKDLCQISVKDFLLTYCRVFNQSDWFINSSDSCVASIICFIWPLSSLDFVQVEQGIFSTFGSVVDRCYAMMVCWATCCESWIRVTKMMKLRKFNLNWERADSNLIAQFVFAVRTGRL
jgi:hypothetical protein